MSTRREFFRRAATLAGGASVAGELLAAIQRAASIDPAPGSTFLDAEHVVILMQENRSFDHALGSLRGVRGFNDPRAVRLPNGNPVWFQQAKSGETFAPFRLNLHDTKITWLGSLPHSWRDQTDARNGGNHDRWLEAKASGRKECAGMPLTLGYFTRQDLPVYYALADAFTVCDHNFCSSLTGTTPNRLYLWSGTIRDQQHPNSPANVRNSDVTYTSIARWKTFPERLEDAGISWRVYQNELSLPTGLSRAEDDWLANFTDNPLEWFEQYHVGHLPTYLAWLEKAAAELPGQIEALEKQQPPTRELALKRRQLERVLAERKKWTPEARARMTERERQLHAKAFTTNTGDPNYRQLTTLRYRDGDTQRQMAIPKGDILHQFRHDVKNGQLPAVSWLVPPSNFSDHPGSPWYGAWCLAEVMNILTSNPEVWKKTIFVLTYDENDGYFDHVPPFVAPEPGNPEAGKVSDGIDAAVEYHPLSHDAARYPPREARGGPIGLGYRVPMIVASPWSRGGYVCSQVFDHTSVLQLLEKLLSHRTGKPIREENISAWRRAVCGDMTSVFRPFRNEPAAPVPAALKEDFFAAIHQAQFRAMPSGWRAYPPGQTAAWRHGQEPGTRPAVPLPYALTANGTLSPDAKSFRLELAAGPRAGSGFHAYTPGTFRGDTRLRTRAYAVAAGASLSDEWALDGFPGGNYHLCLHGPNGFFREFAGSAADAGLSITCRDRGADVELRVDNRTGRPLSLRVEDPTYGSGVRKLSVPAGASRTLLWPLKRSRRWYDLRLTAEALPGMLRRFAGHVETGEPGTSDPAMA
jgi:phospholipase C